MYAFFNQSITALGPFQPLTSLLKTPIFICSSDAGRRHRAALRLRLVILLVPTLHPIPAIVLALAELSMKNSYERPIRLVAHVRSTLKTAITNNMIL